MKVVVYCRVGNAEQLGSQFPPREEVEQLRRQYPTGTRIRLEYTDDPYTKAVPGDMATVKGVDDAGQLMLKWDRGNTSISLIPGIDQFTVINQ